MSKSLRGRPKSVGCAPSTTSPISKRVETSDTERRVITRSRNVHKGREMDKPASTSSGTSSGKSSGKSSLEKKTNPTNADKENVTATEEKMYTEKHFQDKLRRTVEREKKRIKRQVWIQQKQSRQGHYVPQHRRRQCHMPCCRSGNYVHAMDPPHQVCSTQPMQYVVQPPQQCPTMQVPQQIYTTHPVYYTHSMYPPSYLPHPTHPAHQMHTTYTNLPTFPNTFLRNP